MTVILVEKDEKQRASLEAELKRVQPYGQGLQVHVVAEDVKEFVPKLLGQVPNLAPSFFMVDPYGHPLTVPILNDILNRPQTEALINFHVLPDQHGRRQREGAAPPRRDVRQS
jgi:three-Cys-motif partner protein